MWENEISITENEAFGIVHCQDLLYHANNGKKKQWSVNALVMLGIVISSLSLIYLKKVQVIRCWRESITAMLEGP